VRKTWRVWFYGLFVLFWLAAVAVGLEVYEVLHTPAVERAAEAYGKERTAKGYQENLAIVEATAATAPQPPPGVKRDVLPRETFASLDEAGRRDFAGRERALAMVCDRQGTMLAVYPSPEPKELAELAGMARVGASITQLLPTMEGRDALAAIGQVFASGLHVPREYTLPLPSGVDYVCEFFFNPLKDASGAVEQVAVFVRDSIWEQTWLRFRPHVYRNAPFEFWTNALGWRDEEVALPKPVDVYRIVCVGGSTTAQGPRNDLTYPNMLENKLRQHFDTDRIEVINCGIFALTSNGETQRLHDYLALEPDLLIHYNFVNDIGTLLADPPEGLKRLLRKSRFMYRRFNGWLLPSEAELTERIKNIPIANLERICTGAKKAGIDVAVCSFACPDLAHLDRLERDYFDQQINNMVWGRLLNIESYARLAGIYNGLVRDLCEREKVVYVPVAENLKGGIEYFSDICHLFVKAMDLKAGIICAHIESLIARGLPSQEPQAEQMP